MSMPKIVMLVGYLLNNPFKHIYYPIFSFNSSRTYMPSYIDAFFLQAGKNMISPVFHLSLPPVLPEFHLTDRTQLISIPFNAIIDASGKIPGCPVLRRFL